MVSSITDSSLVIPPSHSLCEWFEKDKWQGIYCGRQCISCKSCASLKRAWWEIKETSWETTTELGHGNKLRVAIEGEETDDVYIQIIEEHNS